MDVLESHKDESLKLKWRLKGKISSPLYVCIFDY